VAALRGAFGFLTSVGGAAPPTPAAVSWFPFVGFLLGVVVGAAWWAAARIFPPEVAAGLAVAVDLAATGMLHVDGLADAADGLLPPLRRDRRLEVMRMPDVGAFGVAAVVVGLGLRWVALSALLPADGALPLRRVLLLGALWAASRALMAATVGLVPYARSGGGLADGFRRSGGGRNGGLVVLLAGGVLAGVAAAVGWGGIGLAALGVGLLTGAAVVALAVRRVGGFTGDVLGAAGILCETAGLVAATAWRT
jgi:adenosylcobinamide-GDP ribazoletransferase